METTRNVLVIAYYFPPLGLSGVQRTLKFVKYLPQFGWQPTVLTVTPTGYYAQDDTLLGELQPLQIEIERAGSLDPNRLFRKQGVVKMPAERTRKILTYCSDFFFIPDNKIGWKRQALKSAEKLFEKKQFDVIFATAPPFTDFLIGSALARRFQKPLVIDYRDPWYDYPFKYYPTPVHRWLNTRMESRVLRQASRILTTNRRVKELILIRYKFLDYGDIIILPQGFDPGDFTNHARPAPAAGEARETPKRGKMRITHAGAFYGDRSPRYFLQALRQLFTETPHLRDRIEACFVGNFHDEDRALIRAMGLEDNVLVTGYVDHARCVGYLQDSDVLWFMVNNDTQSPGKLYEYLGARKPILACVPTRGFVRQTLQEARGSLIVEPTDTAGIASAILQFYDQYVQKRLPQPKAEIVEKYNRIGLTQELSKIFGFLTE